MVETASVVVVRHASGVIRRLLRRRPAPTCASPRTEETPAETGEVLREVRLGLVLNGGVSLAVWIGGVTHEIDCMRRAYGATDGDVAVEPTTALYRQLLSALCERVVVDVVAGASAGGINGALLAATVYAETRLPALRDVWIAMGDFSKLLRSPSRREPPSLLRGDDFVLPQIEQRFHEILGVAGLGPTDQPVYLYVTGTDFYGVPRIFADSTGRLFQELEHRRVFQFQHPATGRPGAEERSAVKGEEEAALEGQPPRLGEMPPVGGFDRADAANLLARAARSSSSFPVAFEAHGLRFEDEKVQRWLIDGGVLDNQPFNPVLNRIAAISAGDRPVKRVVGYIVPYVTEPGPGARAAEQGTQATKANGRPTAKQTADAASSLPRDLPKLVSLARIVRELGEGRRASQARERFNDLDDASLGNAAEALFGAFRETRYAECVETFAHWALPGFRAGAGEIGQLETLDPRQALEAPIKREPLESAPTGLRWLPDQRVWERGKDWHWGLSPSERIAAEALARLRTLLYAAPTNPRIQAAKQCASELVADIRAKKFHVCEEFRNETNPDWTDVERADAAYARVVGDELKGSFTELDRHLDAIPNAPDLQRLINTEVVSNAFGVDRVAAPPLFEFLHMSAGVRNSLGHPESSPEQKLAGMKLGHFAGFLKRSWRANDWLWGRLDGIEYLVAAVLDIRHLKTVAAHGGGAVTLRNALSELAFPEEHLDTLRAPWRQTLRYARTRDYVGDDVRQAVADIIAGIAAFDPPAQFRALLEQAADETHDREVRAAVLDCCRAALSASIQLEVLAEELPEVVRAIEEDLDQGASRGSSGADWVTHGSGRTARERVQRFHSLTIGSDEQPEEEASSKLGMDVGSKGLAVAAAAFSGSHGGLPAVVRAPLAAMRGLTLVFSVIVRLLVRTPVLGIAAMIAAAVALVWGLVAPNTLLGAALPALAAVVIGGAAVLLAMATSPLESRCRGFGQGLGLILIVVLPVLLLVLVVGLPFGLLDFLEFGSTGDWLATRVTGTGLDIASLFLLAAVLAALIRLIAGWSWRKLRVIDLWIYRWCYLLAGASIAVGATVEHARDETCTKGQSGWSCIADNWRGTILFLILFGAISLAPLIAEIASGARWVVVRLSGAESRSRTS